MTQLVDGEIVPPLTSLPITLPPTSVPPTSLPPTSPQSNINTGHNTESVQNGCADHSPAQGRNYKVASPVLIGSAVEDSKTAILETSGDAPASTTTTEGTSSKRTASVKSEFLSHDVGNIYPGTETTVRSSSGSTTIPEGGTPEQALSAYSKLVSIDIGIDYPGSKLPGNGTAMHSGSPLTTITVGGAPHYVTSSDSLSFGPGKDLPGTPRPRNDITAVPGSPVRSRRSSSWDRCSVSPEPEDTHPSNTSSRVVPRSPHSDNSRSSSWDLCPVSSEPADTTELVSSPPPFSSIHNCDSQSSATTEISEGGLSSGSADSNLCTRSWDGLCPDTSPLVNADVNMPGNNAGLLIFIATAGLELLDPGSVESADGGASLPGEAQELRAEPAGGPEGLSNSVAVVNSDVAATLSSPVHKPEGVNEHTTKISSPVAGFRELIQSTSNDYVISSIIARFVENNQRNFAGHATPDSPAELTDRNPSVVANGSAPIPPSSEPMPVKSEAPGTPVAESAQPTIGEVATPDIPNPTTTKPNLGIPQTPPQLPIPPRAPVSEPSYQVTRLLRKRTRQGKQEYLVEWQGYPRSQATWEPQIMLKEDMGDEDTWVALLDTLPRKRRVRRSY